MAKVKLPAGSLRTAAWRGRPRFWSSGINGAILAARICSRVHFLADEPGADGPGVEAPRADAGAGAGSGSREGLVAVMAPMGSLQTATGVFADGHRGLCRRPPGKPHAVDLLEVHGADLVADGFDEAGQAEIARAARQSLGGAHDQSEGVGGEDIVAQARAVELGQDEGLGGLGAETGQDRRIGDPGADFLVDREGQGLHQGRLAQEDEIVGVREVLEEEPQFAQALAGQEVGVVDEGHEQLAGAMETEGFLDQEAFAPVVVSLELELESLAEDAQGVVIGVEGALQNCLTRREKVLGATWARFKSPSSMHTR